MLKTLAWLALGLVGGAVLVSWLQPVHEHDLVAEVGAASRRTGQESDLERELASQARRLDVLEARIDEIAEAAAVEPSPAVDANAEIAARVAVIESRLARAMPARIPVAEGDAGSAPPPEVLAAALAAQGYTAAAENIRLSIGSSPSPSPPGAVPSVSPDAALGPGQYVPPSAGGGSAPKPFADAEANASPGSAAAQQRADPGRPAGPPEAPPNLSGVTAEAGQTFVFRVTGSTQGSVWGTDVYTDDSSLGAAAVHAGALRPGESGTVMVTVLPGYPSYEPSTRYGVASSAYAEWGRSYVLQRLN